MIRHEDLNLSKLKINLSGFENFTNEKINIINSGFNIKNINFFFYKENIPIHTGLPLNIIGSNFELQISGNVAGHINSIECVYPNLPSGVFRGFVDFSGSPIDISGLKINEYPVKLIDGNTLDIKEYLDITGIESGKVIEVTGYFYDPIGSILSRTIKLSGDVTGFNRFSGEFNVINPFFLEGLTAPIKTSGEVNVSGFLITSGFRERVAAFATLTGYTGKIVTIQDQGVFINETKLCHLPLIAYIYNATGTGITELSGASIFCGNLDETLATGLITVETSGNISALLPIWTGFKTFFNTWDLTTGNNVVSYNDNNLTGNNIYKDAPQLFKGKLGSFGASVNYSNILEATGVDVALLRVSGHPPFDFYEELLISGRT